MQIHHVTAKRESYIPVGWDFHIYKKYVALHACIIYLVLAFVTYAVVIYYPV